MIVKKIILSCILMLLLVGCSKSKTEVEKNIKIKSKEVVTVNEGLDEFKNQVILIMIESWNQNIKY